MGIDFQGKKVALISVSDKTGIEEFAEALIKLGWDIISSGGTATTLAKANIPVTDVSELTGFPPILDDRVKTLHPKVHGGILAKKTPEHEKTLEEFGIPRINLVCVDLYHVLDAISKPDATIASVMEKTDIGGPTMLRGAAKNHDNDCIVICDPLDRTKIIKELQETGEISAATRLVLAQKVFKLMTHYDFAISQFLAKEMGQTVEALFLTKVRELAYAENKCQNPAYQFVVDNDDDPLAIHKFQIDAGNPSYTALADANGILDILCTLAEAFRRSYNGKVPFIVVAGKHGNPCGVGVDWKNPKVALQKALMGDKVAVMGGEVITNFSITDEFGQALFAPDANLDIGRTNWGLDLIVAPSFSAATIELLGKKEKRRLLSNPFLAEPTLPKTEWMYKQIRGGMLSQKLHPFILTPGGVKDWIGTPLEEDNFATMLIAWAVCWKASSNTVALAKDKMLIGLGCGQQDRIACVRLCQEKANRAGHDIKGSFFASDGFLVYPESVSDRQSILKVNIQLETDIESAEKHLLAAEPKKALKVLGTTALKIAQCDNREGTELLIDAGCIGGVVPADGKNLLEVQEVLKKAGLSVAFVAPENRGFAKH